MHLEVPDEENMLNSHVIIIYETIIIKVYAAEHFNYHLSDLQIFPQLDDTFKIGLRFIIFESIELFLLIFHR